MIARADVEHIARLARIELTEGEKEKFEKDLSSILEFVATLNEIDTSGVQPLTGDTMLENVMRDDEYAELGDRGQGETLAHASPKQRNGYVEVRAVFKRE